ncbi:transferrin receptor protein 1-like [Xyrauchen texanus]|uniref:transferrin receptor protein 1-like n=1 Tax=Xyrauchen texanus TaxID=154827 RepID=UPI002241FC05|nr:transferrin receptor protein 1-like [Xyrauchen texanus]XP_051990200.1 transferrin receptor protein 1-like [Xyrauchen texanus]XP_051990201.1 transferrin receptor protein 1-like [Xyrauchen texanus]
MDQARTTISKIFNGEPRSYTRFNLTQNMEGDNSQVEMKLSSDMEEDMEANGVGRNTNQQNGPYYPSKLSWRSSKSICISVIAILVLFIIGYLIGYLSNRSTDKPVINHTNCPDDENIIPDPVYSLDWSDLRALLKKKLTTSNIESNLKEFSSYSHQAGTAGDEALANKVMGKFKALGMSPWTDEHYVKVQDPGLSYNRVLFRDNVVGTTESYLAYSANGTVKGLALYAYYGRADDFRHLQDKNIDVNGKVILVRAGLLSFAEKVANAAVLNASAVLIYPDPLDYKIKDDTALFGHVHLGTGDPYTPGFPSFNHTQFPPAQSSGLPSILAQTITAKQAAEIMRQLGGQKSPRGWSDGMLRDVPYQLGDKENITVEVNNVLTQKKIHNVFGVIKGYVDADRYIVIGAQRDAWGPGFAKSTVGTSLLVELAKTISDMIKNDGFRPRRSIVFASWSAGEFGSIGATEWLEGYLASLNMKAFSFINLDGIVSGSETFKVSASPLLYELIESTMKQVSSPTATKTLHEQFAGSSWEKSVMEPIGLSDTAYPFQTFSGIPSFSFRFTLSSKAYPFGTIEDTYENLQQYTSYNTPKLVKAAGEVAGLVALRLVHDHLLKLSAVKYTSVIRDYVSQISSKLQKVHSSGRLLETLTIQWLLSALGSYDRAASALASTVRNSDLEDMEQCRIINNRIMRVEGSLLSPFVSPRESPFRHILLGSGSHTLAALVDHLDSINQGLESADFDQLRNMFALATWTIQGCANSLAGEIWELDNEI